MRFVNWVVKQIRKIYFSDIVNVILSILVLMMICILASTVYRAVTNTPCDKASNVAQHNLSLIPDDINFCKKGRCYKGAEWQDMIETLQYTKEQIDSVPDCIKAQTYRDQVVELINYLNLPTPRK